MALWFHLISLVFSVPARFFSLIILLHPWLGAYDPHFALALLKIEAVSRVAAQWHKTESDEC